MRLRRKKKRPEVESDNRVGIFTVPDSQLRLARAQEREAMLHEYELLENAGSDHTEAQRFRWIQLKRELWPEERNPMNGTHRVPGGHGFPVHTKQKQT